MVEKIRPEISVAFSHGNDGRDAYDYVMYSCPKCYRTIVGGYKSETACDRCGTFYDWGDHPARIKTIQTAEW